MKYKYIISLFLVGLILQLFGGILRITHAPGAAGLLKISVAVMIIALVIAIIKLVMTKNSGSFLNK